MYIISYLQIRSDPHLKCSTKIKQKEKGRRRIRVSFKYLRSRIWIYKKLSICCLARSEFIRLCTKVGKMKPPTTFNFSKRKFSVHHTKWPSLRAKSSTRYLSACMFAAHACLTNFLLSSHPRTQPAKTRRKKNANFRESELFGL